MIWSDLIAMTALYTLRRAIYTVIYWTFKTRKIIIYLRASRSLLFHTLCIPCTGSYFSFKFRILSIIEKSLAPFFRYEIRTTSNTSLSFWIPVKKTNMASWRVQSMTLTCVVNCANETCLITNYKIVGSFNARRLHFSLQSIKIK